MRWGLSTVFLVLASSCSFLVVSRGPRVEGQGYERRRVKEDEALGLLGDHYRIAWQGWDGDTIAVVSEAVSRKVFIGPPILPFIPSATGYGSQGNGAYDGEVSSMDRHWLSLLLTIAPGHTVALDPCAGSWIGGRDTLVVDGMLRSDGSLDQAAFLPLPFRCEEQPGPMSWTNRGNAPERVFLMLRFRPGIHLDGGARWTLRLPCTIQGTARTAEFHFRYGQWIHYSPITLVNG
jgi:hypothetical protein